VIVYLIFECGPQGQETLKAAPALIWEDGVRVPGRSQGKSLSSDFDNIPPLPIVSVFKKGIAQDWDGTPNRGECKEDDLNR